MHYVQAAAHLVNDQITATLGFRLQIARAFSPPSRHYVLQWPLVSREMPRLGHGERA